MTLASPPITQAIQHGPLTPLTQSVRNDLGGVIERKRKDHEGLGDTKECVGDRLPIFILDMAIAIILLFGVDAGVIQQAGGQHDSQNPPTRRDPRWPPRRHDSFSGSLTPRNFPANMIEKLSLLAPRRFVFPATSNVT